MKLLYKLLAIFLLTSIFQTLSLFQNVFTNNIYAWDGSKCSYENQCVDNFKCHSPCGDSCGTWLKGDPCGSAVIGGIAPPSGVADYNTIAVFGGGGGNAIGVFAFISVGLRLFTILCGLFMFFNFLWAGYSLITRAGDSKAYADIRERLQYAMIGLVVVVAAYMLAAMIGLIFFGDATFILQPDISRYSAIAPTTP